MVWLSFLLGLADPVAKITNAIVKAKADAHNAKTEEERIAANERSAMLEKRRDVLIAEAGVSRANILVRSFLALPVGILLWKVLVYDKALGQWTAGRTDQLSPELWHVVMVVLGFYFLYEMVGARRR